MKSTPVYENNGSSLTCNVGNHTSMELDKLASDLELYSVKGADDLCNAPPICCSRAIILPRSTKKHTHTVSTKPFEAATCLCVQLYNC